MRRAAALPTGSPQQFPDGRGLKLGPDREFLGDDVRGTQRVGGRAESHRQCSRSWRRSGTSNGSCATNAAPSSAKEE